jgi:benzoate/toluate 1,2-dioxygenase alpha subunit
LHPSDIAALIDDRPEDGVFRVDRRVFTEQEIFDLEMKHIFEGGWVFLGLSSQLPKPHDFITTTIGRRPILVTRDKGGRLGAFLNTCRHKGARICRLGAGNKKLHVCPYHSWSYDSGGRCRAIKHEDKGGYTPAFAAEEHDLFRVPLFEDYKGLLFGSLNPDAPPLREHLGEAAAFIDFAAEQSPEGMELVPGAVRFTYAGNWKLQLENCSDPYHFTSVHTSLLRILDKRHEEQKTGATVSVWDEDRPWQEGAQSDLEGVTSGTFSFANGHVLNWNIMKMSPTLPLYERREELLARFGAAKRAWMFNMRNLTIFPNLQLAENASSQLRVIRPLAPDRTEMLTYCFGPIGESAAARRMRIRQYEDFFNPSGVATPDDTTLYEDCQTGHNAPAGWLQGYARGLAAVQKGANALTAPIGVAPEAGVLGGPELCDETCYHSYYRAWRRRLVEGMVREGAES